MTVPECRIAVGNDPDPGRVKEAVHGLRVMARLGRRAQRALEALERDGEFNEPAIWLKRSNQWDRWITAGAKCFPRYEGVSRKDFPGWGQFKLDFEAIEEDEERNGNTFKYFPLRLVAPWIKWSPAEFKTDEEGNETEEVLKPARIDRSSKPGVHKVGRARIRKRGAAYEATHVMRYSQNEKAVFRLYRDMDWNDSAREVAAVVAKTAASRLVRYNDFCEAPPADMVGLRNRVALWLVEDGFIQKWSTEILDHARDFSLVQEVMVA